MQPAVAIEFAAEAVKRNPAFESFVLAFPALPMAARTIQRSGEEVSDLACV